MAPPKRNPRYPLAVEAQAADQLSLFRGIKRGVFVDGFTPSAILFVSLIVLDFGPPRLENMRCRHYPSLVVHHDERPAAAGHLAPHSSRGDNYWTSEFRSKGNRSCKHK